VLGFIIVSLAATLGAFSKEQAADIANCRGPSDFPGSGFDRLPRRLRKQGSIHSWSARPARSASRS